MPRTLIGIRVLGALGALLLGALSACLDLPEELWREAIRAHLPEKVWQINMDAFAAGRDAAGKLRS